MRRSTLFWVGAGIALSVSAPQAQIQLGPSVFGCGGGVIGDQAHLLHGTVGQSLVGLIGGPSYIQEVGFWHSWTPPQTDVLDLSENLGSFDLSWPYPNPVWSLVRFAYAVPIASNVTICLFDVSGRKIRTLVNQMMPPGRHQALLDTTGLRSGVYYCRMRGPGFMKTRSLILLD